MSKEKPRTPTKKAEQKEQSISGYIDNVGEVLNSKPKESGKVTRFFEFFLYTKSEKKRGVCFSPQKRKYLAELSRTNKGVTMKKIKLEKDLVLNHDTSIIETALDFKKVEPTVDVTSIRDALFRKDLYDYVTVKVKITQLSSSYEQSTANGVLEIRNGIAVDETDEIPISIFGSLTTQVNDECQYEITQCCISTYNSDRLLKTTVNSAIKLLENSELSLSRKITNESIVGKACQIDSSSFNKSYTCKTCKMSLTNDDVDDEILSCSNCDSMFCADDCLNDSVVSFTFMVTKSKKKRSLTANLDMLCTAYKVSQGSFGELPKLMFRTEKKITLFENKILDIDDVTEIVQPFARQ